MDIQLKRTDSNIFGIFGELLDSDNNKLFVTLEHAYYNPDKTYFAKIPVGKWKCVRGKHRLDGMLNHFETFEITGIPSHSGLLFHWGNYNCDSEGCILLGDKIAQNGAEKMITNSKISFNKFMELQHGVDEFWLIIE